MCYSFNFCIKNNEFKIYLISYSNKQFFKNKLCKQDNFKFFNLTFLLNFRIKKRL